MNSPGAHERKTLDILPQPVFSLGSEKLQLSMTRNRRGGGGCPRLQRGLGGGGPLRPTIGLLLVRGEETALDRCPSREHQIMEKK